MGAEQTHAIAGGCHCRNLRLELQWPAEAEPMLARACGCDFCTKHGGAWTSHPAARLMLRITDPATATQYRFGTGTADFHVCRACGVVPAVTCELEGRTYAVVNVNCLESIDPATLECVPADFEGEAVADRLARRQARWIAEVAIEAGPD
jgi:hypothetical protein